MDSSRRKIGENLRKFEEARFYTYIFFLFFFLHFGRFDDSRRSVTKDGSKQAKSASTLLVIREEERYRSKLASFWHR